MLITGGVRSGKSTRGAFKALTRSLDPRVKLIWFVGPQYPQAREEFRYVVEWGIRLGIVAPNGYSMPADGICSLTTITGCRIETRSGEHPERLASVAPNMIVLCEPGQMPSEVYETCLTRLLEKRGDLWMVGTLESDPGKPRWQWFEDFAIDWRGHREGSRERSFALPSWANKSLFPLGENEPEFIEQKSKLADYTFQRRYAGVPSGVNNPVFPLLWEIPADHLLLTVPDGTKWAGGAIGVDYGTTPEHPSAVVAITVDEHGRHWIREAWKGYRSRVSEIQDVVDSFRHNYRIWHVCVDPNARPLADVLNAQAASFKGQEPTKLRFSLANSLLEGRELYFDIMGVNVREVYASMKSMGLQVDKKSRLVYERPLDDDLGQAAMYAIEVLRLGETGTAPPVVIGEGRIRYQKELEGDLRA